MKQQNPRGDERNRADRWMLDADSSAGRGMIRYAGEFK